jgi:hypothetical protein
VPSKSLLTPKALKRAALIHQQICALQALGKKVNLECAGGDEEMQSVGTAIEALTIRAGIALDKLLIDLGGNTGDLMGWATVDDPHVERGKAAEVSHEE